jgi:hypothetical protein
MKMGEGRQEVRRKKGGVGDTGDKKEEAERVPPNTCLDTSNTRWVISKAGFQFKNNFFVHLFCASIYSVVCFGGGVRGYSAGSAGLGGVRRR